MLWMRRPYRIDPIATWRGAFYDMMPRSLRGVARLVHSEAGRLCVLPDFYIPGAERSGSTALYSYLIRHPDIHPPILKEPAFFIRSFGPRNLPPSGDATYGSYPGRVWWTPRRKMNWYRSRFPTSLSKAVYTGLFRRRFVTCDASIYYMVNPLVPRLIKKVTPRARMIFILRNPVRRAWSAYHFHVAGGSETMSFEDALDAEPERIREDMAAAERYENFWGRAHELDSYVYTGMYAKHIRRWIDTFGRDRVLVLQFEELARRPSGVYRKALEFLGMRPHSLPSYGRENAGRQGDMPAHIRERLSKLFGPHNEDLYDLIGERFDWD